MRYLIVDTANTFFRARHSAHRQSDTWDKLGFAIHVTLGSVNKAWRDQKADHVVFCLEGRSWRKDYYEPYKKNRAVARAALTESEQEEDRLFWEAFDNLKTFLAEKTNCTVLQHPELEADDLIAGFIHAHPNDDHVIISSDTDFYQLLAPNVPLCTKHVAALRARRVQAGGWMRAVAVVSRDINLALQPKRRAQW